MAKMTSRRLEKTLRTLVAGVLAVWTLQSGAASAACPEEPSQAVSWTAEPGTGTDDGIGGSGRSPVVLPSPRAEELARGTGDDEDGIGGSGRTGVEGDDGIGGSGLIGTVTGFGSICLNGRRIEYETEVPVSYGGVTSTSDELEIGQVVRVVAREQQALSIDILLAVVGPVERVDDSAFVVMGQAVEAAPGSIVDRAALVAGTRVAVSGLRRPDGKIVASRVDAARAGLSDAVSDMGLDDLVGEGVVRVDVEGYVHSLGADGLSLGYVRFDSGGFDGSDSALKPEVGDRVRVRASRTEAGAFSAARVELVLEARLLRDFERLDVERARRRGSDLPPRTGGQDPRDQATPPRRGAPGSDRPPERIKPPETPHVPRPYERRDWRHGRPRPPQNPPPGP